MTRRDWWLGILVLVAALFVHEALNSYSWHLYMFEGQGQNKKALVRIDRFGEGHARAGAGHRPAGVVR